MRFDVRFNIKEQKIPLSFKHFQSVSQAEADVDYYDAEYEATPQRTEQVFNTAKKMMTRNFVVKPIPSNYGLVTYDNNKTITIT